MQIAAEDEPFYAPPTSSGEDGATTGVLLCHGFTSTPASMRGWGEFLAQQGYAASVPRWPGHGTTWQDLNRTGYADWYAEAERAFEKLQAECDRVFVGGLSMGGCLALNLAIEKGRDVSGLVLVNPAVASARRDAKLVPVLRHLVPCFPGIASDVKKPGVRERAYTRTPLRAAHSILAGMRLVSARLPEVTQPMLVLRSRVDHVVDPMSGRIIMATVSSRDLEERVLEKSYHVATIDNDAPVIHAASAEFIRRVSRGG